MAYGYIVSRSFTGELLNPSTNQRAADYVVKTQLCDRCVVLLVPPSATVRVRDMKGDGRCAQCAAPVISAAPKDEHHDR